MLELISTRAGSVTSTPVADRQAASTSSPSGSGSYDEPVRIDRCLLEVVGKLLGERNS